MEIIKDLLCSFCGSYLSRSPIFILPDGKSVCETCSVANTGIKPYRQYTLEVILKHTATFPCPNKKYGCTETYQFDAELDHERNCIYKPMRCTFHCMFKCDWRGPLGEFTKHVKQQHQSVIREKAEFKIDLNQNKKHSFVVLQDSNLFLVKYNYVASSSSLVYVVAFYYYNTQTQFCKIRLTTYADFTLEFKGCESIPYYEGLLESDIGQSINLHEFMTLLGNPESLSIVLTINNIKILKNKDRVNYNLLNSLKCHSCKYYLILPIYRKQGNLICSDCHYNTKCDPEPLDSTESILLAKANYPCRWHNCNQIFKGDLIGDHEISCEFRMYSCLYCLNNCRLTYAMYKEHLIEKKLNYFKNNDIIYLDKQLEINVSFVKNICLYAFVKFEFVKVHVRISELNFKILFVTTKINKENSKCTIKFQHDHCKAESDNFQIEDDRETICPMLEMPKCFKESDKFTVIITFA